MYLDFLNGSDHELEYIYRLGHFHKLLEIYEVLY